MKEILDIDVAADGWVRLFRSSGYVHHMHRHSELEINLVTRGRGTYLLADCRYDLRKGSQVWLFPEQEHVLVNQSPDLEMWVVVFRPDMVARVAVAQQARVLRASSPQGHFIRQLSAAGLTRVARLCEELSKQANEHDWGCFNAGMAYLLLLAWSVHLRSDDLAAERELHPAVEMAVRLIRDEAEPSNIDELADRCGISPSRLSLIFRQQTGVTLVSYRQKMCLERFLKIYGQGRRTSMLRAALSAGFGSYPQFHRVFKQYMKRSPAEYRRELAGEEEI